MARKILVVEDDPDIVNLLRYHLEEAEFKVSVAEDGEAGLKKARAEKPDLVILDLMLPKMSGLDLCRILKSEKETRGVPILMLTAKAEEMDRVVGLELGAEDYVTKPFSPREVLLRVKAILKRMEGADEEKEEIREGVLTIDIPRREVKIKNKEVTLTKTEFNLLLALVQGKGRVQTRDGLLSHVWGYEASVDTRTIDTHMRRLRGKMGPLGRRFETIRGVGYRYLEEV